MDKLMMKEIFSTYIDGTVVVVAIKYVYNDIKYRICSKSYALTIFLTKLELYTEL